MEGRWPDPVTTWSVKCKWQKDRKSTVAAAGREGLGRCKAVQAANTCLTTLKTPMLSSLILLLCLCTQSKVIKAK